MAEHSAAAARGLRYEWNEGVAQRSSEPERSDGWWVEAWEKGITGWAIDSPDQSDATKHADGLYHKLEKEVLPLFHEDQPRWVWMMKQAISRIGPIFNSQHMMRRYASEAYLR